MKLNLQMSYITVLNKDGGDLTENQKAFFEGMRTSNQPKEHIQINPLLETVFYCIKNELSINYQLIDINSLIIDTTSFYHLTYPSNLDTLPVLLISSGYLLSKIRHEKNGLEDLPNIKKVARNEYTGVKTLMNGTQIPSLQVLFSAIEQVYRYWVFISTYVCSNNLLEELLFKKSLVLLKGEWTPNKLFFTNFLPSQDGNSPRLFINDELEAEYGADALYAKTLKVLKDHKELTFKELTANTSLLCILKNMVNHKFNPNKQTELELYLKNLKVKPLTFLAKGNKEILKFYINENKIYADLRKKKAFLSTLSSLDKDEMEEYMNSLSEMDEMSRILEYTFYSNKITFLLLIDKLNKTEYKKQKDLITVLIKTNFTQYVRTVISTPFIKKPNPWIIEHFLEILDSKQIVHIGNYFKMLESLNGNGNVKFKLIKFETIRADSDLSKLLAIGGSNNYFGMDLLNMETYEGYQNIKKAYMKYKLAK